MTVQYPAIALLTPLAAALVASLVQWIGRRPAWRAAWTAAGIGLAVSLGASIALLMETLREGAVRYWMGGWEPPWGIELAVDPFGAMVMVLIPLTALANLPAAGRIASRAMPGKQGVFCALYLLCATGHMGVVAAGDMFNLYVLIEITALSGYALLSMGSRRAPLSAFNYLLIGSVGASLYLLGVGYVYIMTGTLNMADIALQLKILPLSGSVLAAFAIILAGLMTKMALFPLHAWMPNAYAHASPASAGLLAPLTTKVMIYVLIRMLLGVFGPEISHITESFTLTAVGVAAAAVVFGAVMALAQKELRRMICFILVAEVGYMAGGAFIGNQTAMAGAMLHVVNDSLMTLCIFLGLGNVAYRMGGCSYDSFRGLFSRMPWTMAGVAAGGLSMIGVPPFCGFFSKWLLISGAIEGGEPVFAAALVLSSLVNVVLFFRLFETCFFEKPLIAPVAGSPAGEAPVSMVLPLLLTACMLAAVGLASGAIVRRIIEPSMAGILGI